MAATVLLLSDSTEMGRIWAHVLAQREIGCVVAATPEAALRCWAELSPDLGLIDLYDPDARPLEVCQKWRRHAANPILLLTDARDEASLLAGYEAGADEVILRPLSPLLLLAKVSAWLAHAWGLPSAARQVVERRGLALEPATRLATLPDGRAARLSALEARLLEMLMAYPQRIYSADDLIERLWGAECADAAQLKNVVYRLRRKIEPDMSDPRYVRTVAGQGYTFGVE